MFGTYGSAVANDFIIGSETANTNFSFKEFNSYFKLNFKVDSVFAQNEMIDVLGVTKGKGF